MVWKCLECASRVRCDARLCIFSLGEIRGCFAQTNKKLPKLNTKCWAKKQTFRKRLVGWLLQFIGPMMSWWVMCKICNLFNLSGGENKGSSQVSSDIWVNYVNICRLELELRNTCHVDKLKDTCMRFQNLIEICYVLDVFFSKILIIHPVNSQFSWGNRSSFNDAIFSPGIFICGEPVAFRSFQRAGYRWCVFPLARPVGAGVACPETNLKRKVNPRL